MLTQIILILITCASATTMVLAETLEYEWLLLPSHDTFTTSDAYPVDGGAFRWSHTSGNIQMHPTAYPGSNDRMDVAFSQMGGFGSLDLKRLGTQIPNVPGPNWQHPFQPFSTILHSGTPAQLRDRIITRTPEERAPTNNGRSEEQLEYERRSREWERLIRGDPNWREPEETPQQWMLAQLDVDVRKSPGVPILPEAAGFISVAQPTPFIEPQQETLIAPPETTPPQTDTTVPATAATTIENASNSALAAAAIQRDMENIRSQEIELGKRLLAAGSDLTDEDVQLALNEALELESTKQMLQNALVTVQHSLLGASAVAAPSSSINDNAVAPANALIFSRAPTAIDHPRHTLRFEYHRGVPPAEDLENFAPGTNRLSWKRINTLAQLRQRRQRKMENGGTSSPTFPFQGVQPPQQQQQSPSAQLTGSATSAPSRQPIPLIPIPEADIPTVIERLPAGYALLTSPSREIFIGLQPTLEDDVTPNGTFSLPPRNNQTQTPSVPGSVNEGSRESNFGRGEIFGSGFSPFQVIGNGGIASLLLGAALAPETGLTPVQEPLTPGSLSVFPQGTLGNLNAIASLGSSNLAGIFGNSGVSQLSSDAAVPGAGVSPIFRSSTIGGGTGFGGLLGLALLSGSTIASGNIFSSNTGGAGAVGAETSLDSGVTETSLSTRANAPAPTFPNALPTRGRNSNPFSSDPSTMVAPFLPAVRSLGPQDFASDALGRGVNHVGAWRGTIGGPQRGGIGAHGMWGTIGDGPQGRVGPGRGLDSVGGIGSGVFGRNGGPGSIGSGPAGFGRGGSFGGGSFGRSMGGGFGGRGMGMSMGGGGGFGSGSGGHGRGGGGRG